MRTILLVDDNDAIRGALRAFLEGQGLAIVEASDAAEAIEKADTLNGSLAILVTDAVMPGMSGTELAHILRRSHLELPFGLHVGLPGRRAGATVVRRRKVLTEAIQPRRAYQCRLRRTGDITEFHCE